MVSRTILLIPPVRVLLLKPLISSTAFRVVSLDVDSLNVTNKISEESVLNLLTRSLGRYSLGI